jgi:PKD domain-containing protein
LRSSIALAWAWISPDRHPEVLSFILEGRTVMSHDSPIRTRPPCPRRRILIAWLVTLAAIAPGISAWAGPGDPRFMNYYSPTGVADDAGEPTLGSNWTRESSFSNSMFTIPNGGTTNYFGGFLPYMLNAIFNDCQSPALVTWNLRTLLTANTTRVYGDPILVVDKDTGRTWVSQLEGLTPLGSTTDFTTNDGVTFLPTEGSGIPSCIDHQTIGAGPFHAPVPQGAVYPNAVYYCSQCLVNATCSLSLDGGVTFISPSVPIYQGTACSGLHGHIKIGPDGTAYIPPRACSGRAGVVVSETNGATWTVRTVPGNSNTSSNDDPSVGACINDPNTIYLGWSGSDYHARISRSTDKGITWGPITDVGASLGIQGIAFPAVVAGDRDRAAFAFFGTTTSGGYTSPSFPGVWYLYIATTYNGGATWQTQNVTPGDPIQRGGICGDGTCRNLLDFFDATIDKQGRVLVAGEDGCIGGCVNGPPNSFTAKAFITRQSGGKRMFAVNDPVEPALPQAPAPRGLLIGSIAHLSWAAPDNSGADITSYKLYRRIGASGPFTFLATVSGTSYSEPVNPLDQIFYRLTAVNPQGEGPYCGDYQLGTLVESPCVLPGVMAANDVNPDGTDLDNAQNTPPDPSVNIKALRLAEPYAGEGVKQLTFTLQMAPGGVLTPESEWFIIWNRRTIAADASDRRFVAMKTDATNNLSFVYGNFGPPIPIGSVPPANANTPTVIGNADFGSYDLASGVITIKLATSKADDTPLVPGNDLPSLNVRTFLSRPDGAQRSQNNASDITGDGIYTLVGNASCFCFVDQPPVAAMSASPDSGAAPLTVNFNASASFDPDPGDEVLSYTFNFGDGTLPVPQSSPLASHTYTVPSGSSPFFATLTVKDKRCNLQSLNVASKSITVKPGVGVGPEATPSRLALAPLHNPSHGQVFLDLALEQDGVVNVQAFGADGRRVASLMNSWMPAGKYRLHWAALERDGKHMAAGVYLMRATSNGRSVTARVVLMP